jgi:hypothetical protein
MYPNAKSKYFCLRWSMHLWNRNYVLKNSWCWLWKKISRTSWEGIPVYTPEEYLYDQEYQNVLYIKIMWAATLSWPRTVGSGTSWHIFLTSPLTVGASSVCRGSHHYNEIAYLLTDSASSQGMDLWISTVGIHGRRAIPIRCDLDTASISFQ